jgi:FkbM family methyltransferase
MSYLTKFLSLYYRSGIRGSFRLTDFLAERFEPLQSVPIETEGGTLHVDLRIASARGYLADPHCGSGEDAVMRSFVAAGDTVCDIGAHFGFYSLLLSRLVGENGRVFAFEPNGELLPSLRKTIGALTNVSLLPVALSDRSGKANLVVPEDASMASFADWSGGRGGAVHTVACEMATVDGLIAEGELGVPQFVKCDVEGAELSIFKGASKMLDRADAPVILFEVNAAAARSFGAQPADYFEFLKTLNYPRYSFFDVSAEGIKPLESTEIEYTNAVAIPAVRLGELDQS